MNELVFRDSNGIAMTTSLIVAETFGKDHKHVVRDIEETIGKIQLVDCQCSPNLGNRNAMFLEQINEVAMPNGGTRKVKQYTMNRDGFTLLAMGYTGKKAMEFKLRYIDAFNAMERIIQQGISLESCFVQAIQPILQSQAQISNQMMQLCNTLMQYMGGVVSPQPQPMLQPQPQQPSSINPEEEPTIDDLYPWEGVVTTYRKLRMQYPKHITVMQAVDLLRLRGIVIRKSSLFRFLRESGLISGKNSTYHRPSPECVKKGWMVCMSGRRVSVYPNRHYYTPYLSPEFLDILERKLSAQGVKALELWKEVQP